MSSRSQFAALEIMSREKAAVARKEMEYWLAEAEEWRRLQENPELSTGSAKRSPRNLSDRSTL
jgi:hypothetical protein